MPIVRLPLPVRRTAGVTIAIACVLVAGSCGSGAPRDAATSLDEAVEPRTHADPVAEEDSPVSSVAPLRDGPPLPGTANRPPATTDFGSLPPDLAALRAGLVVPVEGVLRSDLRDSYDEARGDGLHKAMDILVPRGTPVLSAVDGRVLRMFDSRPGGLMVYATDPSERFILLYGHLDGYADGLHDGMPLVRGQVIGYVGTTGNAPADTPHLHFEILRGQPAISWWEGVPVNPYRLLAP